MYNLAKQGEAGSLHIHCLANLIRSCSFRTGPILHVRNVSTNRSEMNHCVQKLTNSVAIRGITPQECSSSRIVSFRFTSAGSVGG